MDSPLSLALAASFCANESHRAIKFEAFRHSQLSHCDGTTLRRGLAWVHPKHRGINGLNALAQLSEIVAHAKEKLQQLGQQQSEVQTQSEVQKTQQVHGGCVGVLC